MNALNELLLAALVERLLGEAAESTGTHKHKCSACGNVWEHPDAVSNGPKEVFDEAHTCSRCGATERDKYFGSEPVSDSH